VTLNPFHEITFRGKGVGHIQLWERGVPHIPTVTPRAVSRFNNKIWQHNPTAGREIKEVHYNTIPNGRPRNQIYQLLAEENCLTHSCVYLLFIYLFVLYLTTQSQ
jgi:hypothetical protein